MVEPDCDGPVRECAEPVRPKSRTLLHVPTVLQVHMFLISVADSVCVNSTASICFSFFAALTERLR